MYGIDLKTKQVFVHYELWEDYHAGMWRKLPKEEEQGYREVAIKFTGDHTRYGQAMIRVVNEWPNTCLHNLTNPSINKRAFIGHAACALVINCPEYIVRQAWGFLTDEQRILANEQADNAIKLWEQEQRSKSISPHGNHGVIRLGYQTKLRLS